MSFITGVGLTPFGRLEGRSTLDLMTEAAALALDDAGLARAEVDGLISGYATTFPHLMLATVFAEQFGLTPRYAQALQVGGATSAAMTMLAHLVVEAGIARNVLVIAGENRLSGQGRDAAVQSLAQVGHPTHEVPLGPTVPAYYGFLGARYLHEHGASEADLAELAVLMRRHAGECPGAHLPAPISVADVLASKPIALPLKLLDCCPVSDGAAAIVVGRERSGPAARIRGTAQAHTHQHVSEAPDRVAIGAVRSCTAALAQAGVTIEDVRYGAIYDSFTVTLALLIEAVGLAPAGRAGALARDGAFGRGGRVPINTHGGLLSYGHCGVAGALAHLIEAQRQLTGRAGARQAMDPGIALLHADGGVLSSHVSLVLDSA